MRHADPLRRSLAALLPIALVIALPLAAADGEMRDVAHWKDGGDVTIADVTVADGAAYAVGTIELPSTPRALHWKGFNASLGPLDSGCAEATSGLFPFGVESRGLAGVVDSSGGLLVGGWVTFFGSETTSRALVARFDLDGPGCALDTTFSGNGYEFFDDETWCDDEDCDVVDLVEIRPQTGSVAAPRIVALVRSHISFLSSRLYLLALTSSGAIDESFGTDGWFPLAVDGGGTYFTEARLGIDFRGRVYVVATWFDPDGTLDQDTVTWRVSPDGVLATSVLWTVDGEPADDPEDTVGKDVAVSQSNALLISWARDTTLARLGLWDDAGNTVQAETTGPYQVTFQGGTRILGVFDYLASDGFATERRIADPTSGIPKDATYGAGGNGRQPYDIDLGGANGETIAELVTWAGRPLVAGTADDATGTSGFLLLAENAYIFADGFDSGRAGAWSALAGGAGARSGN